MNQQTSNPPDSRSSGRLWVLWALPTGAWGAHLLLSYGFVEWFCRHQGAMSTEMAKLILHGLTLVMVSFAIYGGYLGWRTRARLNRTTGDNNRQPGQFMASSGLLLVLLMSLIILVTGAVNLVVPVCIG